MEIRPIEETEITTLVDQLWLPFASEMAALDAYNELADGARSEALAHRESQFEDESTRTFVADRDGDLVGYVTVEERPAAPVFERGPSAHVGDLYVRPESRRQGIATELLDRAERWGRDRNCERVSLSVNVDNEPALRLYERTGYDPRRQELDKPLE